MKPYLSIVIPVYNEEENLDGLVTRLVATCEGINREYEIILVDDGSRDGSERKIVAAAQTNPGRLIGVMLNRNYGQHSAIMAGFAEATGDVIVTLDADLQNPPEEIPRLIERIDAGADVVGSVRIDRRDSVLRRFPSWLINTMVRKVTGVRMRDYGCMLRAYRREIIDAMLQCHERSTFIPVLANTFARRADEIEVRHAERSAGASKYSPWRLVNLLFDLTTCTTTFPLRMLSVIGLLISLAGFAFAGLLIGLRLYYGPKWAVEGTFTLFAVLFIFIGAQFIGMGLLGEYIGRIYVDVRARPRYFVARVVGRERRAERNAAVASLRRDVVATRTTLVER